MFIRSIFLIIGLSLISTAAYASSSIQSCPQNKLPPISLSFIDIPDALANQEVYYVDYNIVEGIPPVVGNGECQWGLYSKALGGNVKMAQLSPAAVSCDASIACWSSSENNAGTNENFVAIGFKNDDTYFCRASQDAISYSGSSITVNVNKCEKWS